MKTTQADISKRLQELEKKVDNYDSEEYQGSKQILSLAHEYRAIMDDYKDSLMDSDLDFLLR